MSIEVSHISKQFGPFLALNDVSLKVNAGELVALLGPSGCGKTTLLRIIAGLESPDRGQVLLAGQDRTTHKARERQVGFVFQHYALFRQMNVFDNVAFGLKVRARRDHLSKADIRAKVTEILQLVQIEKFVNHFPAQLSGGQRQRIALARALAVEPKVLLLDEPFGALDAKVRQELRLWLRRLHERIQLTSIFVTHDQEEAMEVADRIVVMNEGCIEQVGAPAEVFDFPANPFVYRFFGSYNVFHGVIDEDYITIAGLRFPFRGCHEKNMIDCYVRPHELEILPANQKGISSKIEWIQNGGIMVRLFLQRDSNCEPMVLEMPKDIYKQMNLDKGQNVSVGIKNYTCFVN